MVTAVQKRSFHIERNFAAIDTLLIQLNKTALDAFSPEIVADLVFCDILCLFSGRLPLFGRPVGIGHLDVNRSYLLIAHFVSYLI